MSIVSSASFRSLSLRSTAACESESWPNSWIFYFVILYFQQYIIEGVTRFQQNGSHHSIQNYLMTVSKNMKCALLSLSWYIPPPPIFDPSLC